MQQSLSNGTILKKILKNIKPHLEAISEQESAIQPNPNKWSKKQIIGHLVDSASNNHQRFVRANFQDNLVFEGYQQDSWVNLQAYQQSNWIDLVNLWYYYNLHLAQVMEAIPDEVKYKIHHEHTFNGIAWQTIPKDNTATLDYFLKDYIGHLESHLKQIFPKYENVLKT